MERQECRVRDFYNRFHQTVSPDLCVCLNHKNAPVVRHFQELLCHVHQREMEGAPGHSLQKSIKHLEFLFGNQPMEETEHYHELYRREINNTVLLLSSLGTSFPLECLAILIKQNSGFAFPLGTAFSLDCTSREKQSWLDRKLFRPMSDEQSDIYLSKTREKILINSITHELAQNLSRL